MSADEIDGYKLHKQLNQLVEEVARVAKHLFDLSNRINSTCPAKGLLKGKEKEGPSTSVPRSIPKDAPRVKQKIGKSYPEEFESFWEIYPPRGKPPTRNGKQLAYRSWCRLSDSDRNGLCTILKEQLRRKMLGSSPQFYPMAATWLNQRRFEDDIEGPAGEGLSAEDYKSDQEQEKAWGEWGEDDS